MTLCLSLYLLYLFPLRAKNKLKNSKIRPTWEWFELQYTILGQQECSMLSLPTYWYDPEGDSWSFNMLHVKGTATFLGPSDKFMLRVNSWFIHQNHFWKSEVMWLSWENISIFSSWKPMQPFCDKVSLPWLIYLTVKLNFLIRL